MMAKNMRDDVEETAARWAIRLDGEPLDDEARRDLDAWLVADPRRRGLLLRAEAALAYVDRGRALAGLERDEDGEEPSGDEERPPVLSRRALLAGGGLATLAAGLGTFLLLPSRPTEIRTVIGEVRRVPLADGSIASVNTDSKLSFALVDARRMVNMQKGEAWFQVAHDKARPFVVEAGDVRVQAVGTAFSVRLREGGADVLVTDGIVEAWVVGHEDRRVRISAGSRSFIATEAPAIEVAQSADIERNLAWRTGELVLNGESLSYAVSELNRYNQRKLVIDDAALGREPLVGYFRTDKPEDFARAIASMTGANIDIQGDEIRLTR